MSRTRGTPILLAAALACTIAAPAYATLINATDVNPAANIFEAYLTAEQKLMTIGGTVGITVMVFKDDPPFPHTSAGSTIPGPLFNLKVDDIVIVHFKNNLPSLSASIHWHGIELDNDSDGTAVTQDAVLPGQSYVYRFKTRRPGLFWYHPHMLPGNATFAGMYGPIIVENQIEASLIAAGTLPDAASTFTLALSDIEFDGTGFVGKPLPSTSVMHTINDLVELCHLDAIDNGGDRAGCSIPPGNTVLVNGEKPDATAKTPLFTIPSGKRIRLRLMNESIARHFRLKLMGSGNNNLYRVGGQGGLLDRFRLEGGVRGSWDTKYDLGEINLGSGDRADVVFFASGPQNMLITLVGNKLPAPPFPLDGNLPTNYPICYFKISGSAGETPPAAGDPILASTAEDVENIKSGVTITSLVDPAPYSGSSNETIILSNDTPVNPGYTDRVPNIDLFASMLDTNVGNGDFLTVAHPPTTRTAHIGDILELTVKNTTVATHPYHLHGFSFQPVGVADSNGVALYNYNFDEFMDTIDVYGKQAVTLRVRLDERPKLCDESPSYPPGPTLAPCASPGSGARGRWLMHCHIFHHAGLGMMSELDVLPAGATDVSDRPAPISDEPMLASWADDRVTFGVSGSAPAPTLVAVYDVGGRRLDHTELGVLTEGLHRMTWSLGTRLETGLYFLRAGAPGRMKSARFAVVR